jgi:Tol biopolymer transport system component
MPSNRTLVLAAAGLGVVAAAVVAAVVLVHDDPPTATGDLIAYSCKEPKNPWYAVCTVRSDGTGAERMTHRLSTTDPDWSPDGRQIAFTRNEDTGEYTPFTHDDVFVMDADGSDIHQVTPDKEGRSLSQPDWSPDGRQLLYLDGESVQSAVPSRYGDLYVIGVDGSGARRLAPRPITDPDWSPDGREIVFVRGENLPTAQANDDLWVRNVGTGAERRLTSTPPGTYEQAPAWSPDGSRIAFVRFTSNTQYDGTSSIQVMNRDGSGERQLLAHTLFAYAPYSLAWSPDGTTIAFEASSTPECVAISLIAVDSAAVRPLTSCSRAREVTLAPAWQPAPDTTD